MDAFAVIITVERKRGNNQDGRWCWSGSEVSNKSWTEVKKTRRAHVIGRLAPRLSHASRTRVALEMEMWWTNNNNNNIADTNDGIM